MWKSVLRLAGLTCALAACGDQEASPAPEVGHEGETLSLGKADSPRSRKKDRPRTSAACPGLRWIGEADEGGPNACPRPADDRWTVEALFEEDDQEPASAPLDRFCLYEWQGDPDGVPAAPPPLHEAGNDWLDADCRTVAPMGRVADVLGPQMVEAYYQQVDAAEPLPGDPDALARVRIAVADSSSPGFDAGRPTYGQFDHGRVVALTARHLGCRPSGSACVSFIDNRLALPRDREGRATLDGGWHGYQTEVAVAIYNSVARWLAYNRGAGVPHDRLIINLSLGWEGRYGGDFRGDSRVLPAPVAAVYRTIEWARCNGALVVAAAGNSDFGPAPGSGPLYPAGWGRKLAPNGIRCGAFAEVVADPDRPAFTRRRGLADPMVVAVAGLDYEDRRLHNARAGTRTPIEAHGYQVLARDFDPDGDGVLDLPPEPTTVLTGSSMAAATLSGTAAAVWSHAPDLPPVELMELIRRTGVDLGVSAQICPNRRPGRCGTVRRLSMCRALEAVCSRRPGLCAPGFGCPDTVPAYAGSNFNVDAGLDDDGDGTPDIEATVGYTDISIPAATFDGSTPGCGGVDVLYDRSGGVPPVTCPQEQHQASLRRPWVGPQPPSVGCDVCVFSGGAVKLEMSDALDPGVTFTDATFTTFDSAANVLDNYNLASLGLGLDSLTAGGVYKVSTLAIDAATAKGTISFTYLDEKGDKASVVDAVLMD